MSSSTTGPRACTTCAKAKSRCGAGPTPEKCERCHRLNKPCASQIPARPRKRKNPRRTKVQDLEHRLEELTTRLESTTGRSISSAYTSETRDGDSWQMSRAPFTMGHLFPNSGNYRNSDTLPTSPNGGPRSSPSSHQVGTAESPKASGSGRALLGEPKPQSEDVPPTSPGLSNLLQTCQMRPSASEWSVKRKSLWPVGDEADEFLSSYRKHAAHLFPFVVIPEHMSLAQLRTERPYLWKGVVMHASHVHGQRQVFASSELVNEIVSASFYHAAKNLDMLQGLLVMLAWFHYGLNTTQVTNLLFLARSMVATMGLCDKVAQLKLKPSIEITSTELEEARTLAGTYYLLSLIFIADKKPECLMDTAHIEDCCGILESRADMPGDLLVVALTRIQMLSHNIITSVASTTSHSNSQLPFHILIKTFCMRILSFRRELPEDLVSNPTLNCHIHTAHMLLYEPSISDGALQPSFSASDRIPLLWQTLQAAKNYIAIRSSNVTIDRPHFICMSGYDFMYAFIVCLKLVLLNVPGWDVQVVKQELNLEPFIDMQVRHFNEFARRRFAGGGGERARQVWNNSHQLQAQDPFHKLGAKLRHLKRLFHWQKPSVASSASVSCPTTAVSNPSTVRTASLHTAAAKMRNSSTDGVSTASQGDATGKPILLHRTHDVNSSTNNATTTAMDLDGDDTATPGIDFHFDMSAVEAPTLDGFDPVYWHDIFNDNAMKFYSVHTNQALPTENSGELSFGGNMQSASWTLSSGISGGSAGMDLWWVF